jgi:microsomal dipeptidase-like Zn-dependent dipeptidase
MELCRLTPQNAHGYIGYEVLFKSRGASIVKKLISVSKTSVQVDHPDLCNNLAFSRRIYVLVEEEEAVEEEEDAMTFFESLEKEEEAVEEEEDAMTFSETVRKAIQRQESTLEDAMAFLESLEEKKEEAVVTPSDADPSRRAIQEQWFQKFLKQHAIKNREDLLRCFPRQGSRSGQVAYSPQIYASAEQFSQHITTIPTWKDNIRHMVELNLPGYKVCPRST